MKKLLAMLLLVSILAFAVSCGNDEEPDAGNNSDDIYEYPDEDGDGNSDIFDEELPPINLDDLQ